MPPPTRLCGYHMPTHVFTSHINWRLICHTPVAPLAPAIIPEDCSAENNSVTVAWQAPNHSFVEGYVLELDDGRGGEFRVSNFECHCNYKDASINTIR